MWRMIFLWLLVLRIFISPAWSLGIEDCKFSRKGCEDSNECSGFGICLDRRPRCYFCERCQNRSTSVIWSHNTTYDGSGSVCVMAQHAGFLRHGGAVVTRQRAGLALSSTASNRNGIKTISREDRLYFTAEIASPCRLVNLSQFKSEEVVTLNASNAICILDDLYSRRRSYIRHFKGKFPFRYATNLSHPGGKLTGCRTFIEVFNISKSFTGERVMSTLVEANGQDSYWRIPGGFVSLYERKRDLTYLVVTVDDDLPDPWLPLKIKASPLYCADELSLQNLNFNNVTADEASKKLLQIVRIAQRSIKVIHEVVNKLEQIAKKQNISKEVLKKVFTIADTLTVPLNNTTGARDNLGGRLLTSLGHFTNKVNLTDEPIVVEKEHLTARIQRVKNISDFSLARHTGGGGLGALVDRKIRDSLTSVSLPHDIEDTSRMSMIVLKEPNILRSSNYHARSVLLNLQLTGHGLKTPLYNFSFYYNGNSHATCGFWNTTINDWDTAGCWMTDRTNTTVYCTCNHLTSFAILTTADFNGSVGFQKAFSIISRIGLCLSIIPLILLLITFVLFKIKGVSTTLSQDILLQLSIALLSADLVFVIGIDLTQNKVVCSIVAALLQYLYLVCFAWMLVEAVHYYLRLVKVLDTYIPRFKIKTVVPCWCVPTVFVAMVAAYDHRAFIREEACWLQTHVMLYFFVTPACCVLVANCVLYGLILRSVCRKSDVSKSQLEHRELMLKINAAISCLVVVGLTWLLGFPTLGPLSLPVQLIFVLLNSIQGLLIFILHIARYKLVQRMWMKRCFGRLYEKHKLRFRPNLLFNETTPSSDQNARFDNNTVTLQLSAAAESNSERAALTTTATVTQ